MKEFINQIILGNALTILKQLPEQSINTCVTSPPYWGARDYGVPATEWPGVSFSPIFGIPEINIPEWKGCLGLEPTPNMYVGHVVFVFREVLKVLRDDGTLWINLGDCFSGSRHGLPPTNTRNKLNQARKCDESGIKHKNILTIPWRVAAALQADGWYLRSDIIWDKPNCLPESAKDRPTKSHEYVFLLAKSQRYYFDSEAFQEPVKSNKGNTKTFRGGGYIRNKTFDNSAEIERDSHGTKPNEKGTRNRRTVWTIPTQKYMGKHSSTFPEKLVEPCILAGCPPGGIVLDPFMGTGTTAKVAKKLKRNFVGIELNPNSIEEAEKRIRDVQQVLI